MQFQRRTLALTLLVSGLGLAGCTGQFTFQNSPEAPISPPFQGVSAKGGWSPTGPLVTRDIPSGTLLIVRLRTRLSSASSHDGDEFEAVLDEPIAVHGQILAPKGAPITGRILAAMPSVSSEDPGYLRLTLSSLSVGGQALPIQVASIFLKARSGADANDSAADGKAPRNESGRRDVQFLPQHRLTFRLAHTLLIQG